MRRIVFMILTLLCCLTTSAQTQEHEYVPLAREGVKWVYYVSRRPLYSELAEYGDWYLIENKGWLKDELHKVTYYFEGDTIVEELDEYREHLRPLFTYKKLWRVIDAWPRSGLPTEPQLVALVQDYNKAVYVMFSDGFRSEVACVDWSTENFGCYQRDLRDPSHFYHPEHQYCMYDFNDYPKFLDAAPRKINLTTRYVSSSLAAKPDGQVVIAGKPRDKFHLYKVPRYNIDTGEKKLLELSHSGEAEVIEGYGALVSYCDAFDHYIEPGRFFFLNYNAPTSNGFCYCIFFSHVEEDGQVAYKGKFYDKLMLLLGPDDPTVGVEESAAPEPGEGATYDMQGRPAAADAPGIYVRDGKKVLVK